MPHDRSVEPLAAAYLASTNAIFEIGQRMLRRIIIPDDVAALDPFIRAMAELLHADLMRGLPCA